MAEKSKGGGGFFWFIVGLLFGIALTLAALLFLNSEPAYDDEEGPSAADAAAASSVEQVLPADPAQLPAPAAETRPSIPRPADAGIDPQGDDQIADDAAAAGMTSRTPSPLGE